MEAKDRYVDWSHHDEGPRCATCRTGFPIPCRCGGFVHADLITLPAGGYVQVTRCDRCGQPKTGG